MRHEIIKEFKFTKAQPIMTKKKEQKDQEGQIPTKRNPELTVPKTAALPTRTMRTVTKLLFKYYLKINCTK